MTGIATVFGIMETAVAVLKPIISTASTGDDKASRVVKRIFGVVETAIGLGNELVTADERLAARLDALKAELEAIQLRGGVQQSDMTELARRASAARTELQRVMADRRAAREAEEIEAEDLDMAA